MSLPEGLFAFQNECRGWMSSGTVEILPKPWANLWRASLEGKEERGASSPDDQWALVCPHSLSPPKPPTPNPASFSLTMTMDFWRNVQLFCSTRDRSALPFVLVVSPAVLCNAPHLLGGTGASRRRRQAHSTTRMGEGEDV